MQPGKIAAAQRAERGSECGSNFQPQAKNPATRGKVAGRSWLERRSLWVAVRSADKKQLTEFCSQVLKVLLRVVDRLGEALGRKGVNLWVVEALDEKEVVFV